MKLNPSPEIIDDEIIDSLSREIEQSRFALQEVRFMLEQSQNELVKLNQRNATVSGELQQVQARISSLSSDEIKSAYNIALDTQQRLLVMRGQLERLQSEQNHLAKFIGTLEKTRELIHSRIDVNRPRSILDANPVELAIDAQESLRQYLSLQMHDGPAQNLSNFMLRVDIANRLIDIDIVKAKEELANLKNEASKTFNNVKQYISELRPLSLDEHGLIPSIKKYIDGFSEKTGHEVSFSSQGHDERYKSYNEIMVYRAVQEILSDSHRNFHEQPEKLILSISLTLQPGKIILSVADNSGGSVKLLHQIEENHELGLFIKRLNLLGGSLNIEKTDEQTELIVFTIPVN